MNKLLTIKQLNEYPELYIKYMCYDIFISVDNQVFNLSLTKILKEQLIGGSYCYYCNKKYRTKKWILENSVNVLGSIVN